MSAQGTDPRCQTEGNAYSLDEPAFLSEAKTPDGHGASSRARCAHFSKTASSGIGLDSRFRSSTIFAANQFQNGNWALCSKHEKPVLIYLKDSEPLRAQMSRRLPK